MVHETDNMVHETTQGGTEPEPPRARSLSLLPTYEAMAFFRLPPSGTCWKTPALAQAARFMVSSVASEPKLYLGKQRDTPAVACTLETMCCCRHVYDTTYTTRQLPIDSRTHFRMFSSALKFVLSHVRKDARGADGVLGARLDDRDRIGTLLTKRSTAV